MICNGRIPPLWRCFNTFHALSPPKECLVLATFRSEDLNPDNEGHPHPLVDTLRLMGRESLYREIKLPSLSRPDVSLLAENMVGGRVQSEFAQKLANESQGNPLFIVESLKMLSEKGSLVQENDTWRLSTDEIGIPDKIKDIILRRVGALKAWSEKNSRPSLSDWLKV